MGTPVVTLPSPFARGRITYAQYRMLDMPDCCVSTAQEYIDLAVRLGTDPGFRSQTGEKILERSSRLFERRENIEALEEFLGSVSIA